MKILYLSGGAGSFICGTCVRDRQLVKGLEALGHDVTVLNLYLPWYPEASPADKNPIFFGGINVYLQHKWRFFRGIPQWMDGWLNARPLLKLIAGRAGASTPQDMAGLTLSMMKDRTGHQKKELDRMCRWLKRQPRPDVICLSNALLCGLAGGLRDALDVPVFCTLQGEETFLRGLEAEEQARAWETLRERTADIDGFIAVSSEYGRRMAERLHLDPEGIFVAANGIALDSLQGVAPPAEEISSGSTVGYLARMMPEKGLHILIEAFIHLRSQMTEDTNQPRLRVAGVVTKVDELYFEEQKRRIEEAGLGEAVDFLPNLPESEKHRFLQSIDVLTVPADATESFGLYVLEALANGVPVVGPDHAAFPEIFERTGGGVLVPPNDPQALARELQRILSEPDLRQSLGTTGRQAVQSEFGSDQMAGAVAEILAGKIERSPQLVVQERGLLEANR
ncbi:MAG: glycosyl transferase group 1 [Myxococcales bacterium]|nr:glycosyl transferase group 1 [Myxococcales bacterium]